MDDPQIVNHIMQWSNGDPKMMRFLNSLKDNDIISFPKTKKHAIALYKIASLINMWSANDQAKKRYFENLLEHDPLHFPPNQADAIAQYEAYCTREPIIGALSIEDGGPNRSDFGKGAPKMGSLGSDADSESAFKSKKKPNAPKKKTKSEESIQRSRGEPITNPTRRSAPIKVFCGGGKHCGFKVEYDQAFNWFPRRCDGFDNAQRHASKDRRVNHDVNWDDIVCVNNRCIVARSDLNWVLEYGCCSGCKKGLHGGIISRYGLVLH